MDIIIQKKLLLRGDTFSTQERMEEQKYETLRGKSLLAGKEVGIEFNHRVFAGEQMRSA